MEIMASSLASLRIRIDPEQIYFLKFILEGYDNLTIMSTVDRIEGVMELKYPPELGGGCERGAAEYGPAAQTGIF